jgi:hypothetical protein
MATVSTVTAIWTGFTGAPGYSRFNFAELVGASALQSAVNAVRAFLSTASVSMLTGWGIQVQTLVQHHDLATGDLVGEATAASTPPNIAGSVANTTAYAGGSGLVANWVTGQFWNGRKVRGRTFIVPAVNVYSSDGTITSTIQTNWQAAGNTFAGSAGITPVVWAKKFDGSTPPQQQAGAAFAVTGCVVPDRAAQLRTRRS